MSITDEEIVRAASSLGVIAGGANTAHRRGQLQQWTDEPAALAVRQQEYAGGSEQTDQQNRQCPLPQRRVGQSFMESNHQRTDRLQA